MAGTPRSFTVTANAAAPADRVFSLVSDSTTWPTWTPVTKVERANLAPDGTEQVGTLRSFHIGIGKSVEEVTGLFPGKKFTYSLRKGMPIAMHTASVTVEPQESGCAISWFEEFTPVIPGTGAFFEWFLHAFIKKCIDGLVKKAEN